MSVSYFGNLVPHELEGEKRDEVELSYGPCRDHSPLSDFPHLVPRG